MCSTHHKLTTGAQRSSEANCSLHREAEFIRHGSLLLSFSQEERFCCAKAYFIENALAETKDFSPI